MQKILLLNGEIVKAHIERYEGTALKGQATAYIVRNGIHQWVVRAEGAATRIVDWIEVPN